MSKQNNIERVPYKATVAVSTKLSPEMRRDLKFFAAGLDVTPSTVIKMALEMYVQRNPAALQAHISGQASH